MRGSTSVLFQFQLTLAIFVAALIGLALPHYTYQISADDFLWRVMAGFPIAVGGLQMVLFLIFYRLDTP